jgi:hypothetical protein
MRKPFFGGLSSLLLSTFLIYAAHAQLTSLTEGFDNAGNSVPTATGIFAQAQPWVNVNNSDLPNTAGFNWEGGTRAVLAGLHRVPSDRPRLLLRSLSSPVAVAVRSSATGSLRRCSSSKQGRRSHFIRWRPKTRPSRTIFRFT